jgi:hypothetical protein
MQSWADERPNDHDRPGLARRMPCPNCDHDEHVLRCDALLIEIGAVVRCPCRDVPVPGVHV